MYVLTRCHVTDINHVLTPCHITEINYVDRGVAARTPLQFYWVSRTRGETVKLRAETLRAGTSEQRALVLLRQVTRHQEKEGTCCRVGVRCELLSCTLVLWCEV